MINNVDSYVGWFLTEKYYADLGYEKSPNDDISGQGRQTSWYSTRTGDWGYYSPLLVDLVDNFDQASYHGSRYNDDRIKGTPYSTVMKVARDAVDWPSAAAILRAAPLLAGQDMDTFLAPYEYWHTH